MHDGPLALRPTLCHTIVAAPVKGQPAIADAPGIASKGPFSIIIAGRRISTYQDVEFSVISHGTADFRRIFPNHLREMAHILDLASRAVVRKNSWLEELLFIGPGIDHGFRGIIALGATPDILSLR